MEITQTQLSTLITEANSSIASANAILLVCQQITNGNGQILGCTNPSATNYDPAATQDDGSCLYDEV